MFEEVLIGLYDRFAHPSAMEDAWTELEQVEYNPAKRVQRVYDKMQVHARNMAEPPDNHTLVKSVGAAKALEMTERTAQLYEQHVGRRPIKRATVSASKTPAIRRDNSVPRVRWKPVVNKPPIAPRRFHKEDRGDRRKSDGHRMRPRESDRPREANDKPRLG